MKDIWRLRMTIVNMIIGIILLIPYTILSYYIDIRLAFLIWFGLFILGIRISPYLVEKIWKFKPMIFYDGEETFHKRLKQDLDRNFLP